MSTMQLRLHSCRSELLRSFVCLCLLLLCCSALSNFFFFHVFRFFLCFIGNHCEAQTHTCFMIYQHLIPKHTQLCLALFFSLPEAAAGCSEAQLMQFLGNHVRIASLHKVFFTEDSWCSQFLFSD